jgi:hypothetical protein
MYCAAVTIIHSVARISPQKVRRNRGVLAAMHAVSMREAYAARSTSKDTLKSKTDRQNDEKRALPITKL